MTTITDEFMKQMLTMVKNYTVVILKPGLQRNRADAQSIIWEHGRRNFALRQEGKLSIVCPFVNGSEVSAIGIFNCSAEETTKIMNGDPAVLAEIFVYEVHPCRSFPGDALPK